MQARLIDDAETIAPHRQYRVYFLDANGRIRSAKDIVAEHDEAAIVLARSFHRLHGLEIWQLARRVAVIPGPTLAKRRAADLVAIN